jgi:tetratricopeptide (TPR) repeat protein
MFCDLIVARGKFMETITLDSLIDTIRNCSVAGKRYCFILGAGASKASGIKTGTEMAKEWLKEMKKNEPKDLQEWIEKEKIDINDPGSHYSKIYEQRFRVDPASGFIRLQNEMEKAIPSPGYYFLSEIIYDTQNKLVITTNFDSLIEDSLYIYKNKNALVITHESLAKYIDVLPKRPTVIKVHRDLLLQPKSGQADVKKLSKGLKSSLQRVMDIYDPIIIGYGGNDGSLMDFLKMVASKNKNIYWCYKKDNSVNKEIYELLDKYHGFLIPIDNFDDTMLLFGEQFGYKLSEETIQKVTEELARMFTNKYNEWRKNKKGKARTKELLSDAESMVLESSLNKNLSEFEKQKNAINYYKIGNEYYFQNDYIKAIEFYTKAIKLNPINASYYYNRSVCYSWLKEYEKAIEDQSKAIKFDSNNALYYNNRGKYYQWLKEYEKAIEDQSKAIEFDSNNALYYLSLVRVLCRIGDFNNALINLNKAMSLNNKLAVCYNVRGFFGIKKAKQEETKCKTDVLDDLNKAIELNEDDSFTNTFYNDRAEYYLYSNEPDKAYDDLQKVLALNNMNGRTFFLMARYYESKGNTQECNQYMIKMREYRYIPDSNDY